MRVGLIDVDSHRFPNLALMKLSAYHKSRDDSVEWYQPLFSGHMDVVYKSKVFSFTQDYEHPIDADRVIGGGYGILHKKHRWQRDLRQIQRPCFARRNRAYVSRLFPV